MELAECKVALSCCWRSFKQAMSRQSPHESSPPETSLNLKKMAIALLAGTVLVSRARVGGTIILAGLAWLATRGGKTEIKDASVGRFEEALPPPVESIDELCVPSDPFIGKEETSEGDMWQDLRAALIPPRSLFTPALSPQPPLLNSTPVFVEVVEAPINPVSVTSVLPDIVEIPTTPDPPLGLLADSAAGISSDLPHLTLDQPPLVPKVKLGGVTEAGFSQLTGRQAAQAKATETDELQRKGFLGWLRE